MNKIAALAVAAVAALSVLVATPAPASASSHHCATQNTTPHSRDARWCRRHDWIVQRHLVVNPVGRVMYVDDTYYAQLTAYWSTQPSLPIR
jgi:hypothetical protein